MFKLYKRGPDGVITDYHEVWVEPRNRRIIEHWGALGEQGEAKPHRIWLLRRLDDQVEALLRPARDAGYREIGLGEHVCLIVDFGAGDASPEGEFERREDVEDRLNEILGWTGLGHCDGDTDAAGRLEVACEVVDFELARTVIAEALAEGDFGAVTRIYRLD